ncbi:SufS family cysteine desulfurase [Candidatus Micrarchaeota archaeon]|nr:SufS family cysteine desulfurase [Candidatus Micrarchaeota archaeon]MBU1930655.1 SufS family cysteine desulfurase [Candidatus Micrarchaeota archaeon]
MNTEKIKKDFPILKRKINGKPLAFLDNAATTQKPFQVINAITDFYENHNANVHRGKYVLSEEASQLFENARKIIGELVGVTPAETIFTRNTTESLNVLAFSLAQQKVLQKDDTVLLSHMEHHANLVPWIQLKEKIGIKLGFVPLKKNSELDLEQLDVLLQKKPKIVSITHCSNVLGTINPIKEIARKVHDANALLIVDAAQSVPRLPVNFKKLEADFLAFSAHKMLGPTGIGCLIGKKELLESLPPFLTGGEMIETVSWEKATWNELPWKFEAGTQNIAGAIGWKVAADYLQKIGLETVHHFEQKIGKKAFDALSAIKEVGLYGPTPSKKCALFSFNLKGVHPHDVATVLDSEGIAVRSGNHCAQPLLRELGADNSVRASLYIYNTEAEVERLVNAIEKTKKVFKV